jgi:hypothetical protein
LRIPALTDAEGWQVLHYLAGFSQAVDTSIAAIEALQLHREPE